ncbi:MAG: glycosyltransferase [Candidatus Symbiothrix sp.]|jgi:glycosyltransferase involved in cell wall biosynthesis|nr:glycosyltransferase [Candidatus Symbiothrix sp.]
MKIALLIGQFFDSNDTFIVTGWTQSLILTLQQSESIELAVMGLTNASSIVTQEENIRFYKIKYRMSPNPLVRIYQKFTCKMQDEVLINDYIEAIQDFNPDIVQIFGTENFLCTIIPYLECKVVVHLQGLLNPYVHAYFPPGISANLFYRKSFHWFSFLRGMGERQQFKMFQAMAKRELTYFNTIRFVMGRTEWDKTIAESLAQDVTYFHLAEVLRSDFYTATQWQPHQRKIMQFISVLSPATYKGFDLILKTADLLKSRKIQFQWIICGSSSKDCVVKTIEKIMKKKYIANNISLVGKKTSKELVSLLLDSDIFIHPSYIENSPNSVCEAQIVGLPVVATNVGGISSLVNNDETGILVPPNDPYYLSGVITSLLSNPSKMQYLGMNARSVAKSRHDREGVLENIERIYQQIRQAK